MGLRWFQLCQSVFFQIQFTPTFCQVWKSLWVLGGSSPSTKKWVWTSKDGFKIPGEDFLPLDPQVIGFLTGPDQPSPSVSAKGMNFHLPFLGLVNMKKIGHAIEGIATALRNVFIQRFFLQNAQYADANVPKLQLIEALPNCLIDQKSYVTSPDSNPQQPGLSGSTCGFL